MRFPVSHQ